MCVGCFSGTEAAVTQGAAGVMFVKSEFSKRYGQWTGLDPDDRRRSTYDANADFVASLGLDPEAVLGMRADAVINDRE